MKKNTFKFILFICFAFFSLSLSAQSDEDTGAYTTCNADGENASRTSNDLPNPVNVGTIDDRSCYANYKESNINGLPISLMLPYNQESSVLYLDLNL